MDCHDIENNIPQFIEDKLKGNELRDFLLHIDSCQDCFKELETEFMLKEALLRLEDGNSFNLKDELKDKIKIMRRCLHIHSSCSFMRRILIVDMMCMLCWVMYAIFLV